jgi:hypothetical protein
LIVAAWIAARPLIDQPGELHDRLVRPDPTEPREHDMTVAVKADRAGREPAAGNAVVLVLEPGEPDPATFSLPAPTL